MLTHNQIRVLTEFSRIHPDFKTGEAWCYDTQRKILYSAVNENKLKSFFKNLPDYSIYVIITARTIERLQPSASSMR